MGVTERERERERGGVGREALFRLGRTSEFVAEEGTVELLLCKNHEPFSLLLEVLKVLVLGANDCKNSEEIIEG